MNPDPRATGRRDEYDRAHLVVRAGDINRSESGNRLDAPVNKKGNMPLRQYIQNQELVRIKLIQGT
jgi:hypothetical protein